MDLRKNSPLIIGISIPVLMILFVAGSIYLPGLFADPPMYDFLYTTGNDHYYCEWEYRPQSGRLVRVARPERPPVPVKDPSEPPCDPLFYLYDVDADESMEIPFAEAEKLTLDQNSLSKDGYEVVRGNGGGDFLFFDGGSNYNNVYIRGHNWSKKINVNLSSQPYYYYNFRFLGWIIPS